MTTRPPLKKAKKQKQKNKEFSPFDWLSLKTGPVIGVDEVGRGCLAGPVYAAAVILNPNQDCSPYTDSKLLSAQRREELSQMVFLEHQAAIGIATVEEIKEFNILRASLLAMRRAVLGLRVKAGHLLVDGTFEVPNMKSFTQTTLVKGDLRAAPVAAASIVAKVARDNWMAQQAKVYPKYGFENHKGYSTPEHKAAIVEWGPCQIHRETFAGVKEFISKETIEAYFAEAVEISDWQGQS